MGGSGSEEEGEEERAEQKDDGVDKNIKQTPIFNQQDAMYDREKVIDFVVLQKTTILEDIVENLIGIIKNNKFRLIHIYIPRLFGIKYTKKSRFRRWTFGEKERDFDAKKDLLSTGG